MNKKKEIYHDIKQNCDIILNLLKNFKADNKTPEGRMIYQCRWLKEQVVTNLLPLPTKEYVHTLNYISGEGLLDHIANSKQKEWQEIGVYLYRLVVLVDNKLVIKKQYYPATINMIDSIIYLLNHSSRALSEYEHGMLPELEKLKSQLSEGKIEPPLQSYLPDYPNFRKVYRLYESTIDDLPNGKYLCETVASLIFEGIRPDSWLTPEDADKESQKLLDGVIQI